MRSKMSVVTALLTLCLATTLTTCVAAQDEDPGPVYFTMGVHNDLGCEVKEKCLPPRKAGEPSDPLYPEMWISDWTMFRVFNNYEENPPPYTNPPSTLKPEDYQVSYGTTYYDSTYVPADGDGTGAMMEHYDRYCLPIFPIKNNFTCSFISLGNKAYFLTYEKDRPEGMPPCCLFSPQNHPPRRDFIKHLPYSASRSQHLNGSVQAYAVELPSPSGKILFGYAFNKEASPDGYTTKPYRHPQSFFFSGSIPVVNAPIVSQNYTSFRAQEPDAAETWRRVEEVCPPKPVLCRLFDPPEAADSLGAEPGWSQLEPRP